MLTFTHGDIQPKSIKSWLRKNESKLTASQPTNTVFYAEEDDENECNTEDDINEIEHYLAQLQDQEPGGDLPEEEILSEKEAAEILATFLERKKKKTFVQTQKAKKYQELSRGYGSKPQGSLKWGRDKRPHDRNQGKGLSIQEVKPRTRCGICRQVGHWHRECPSKDDPKPGSA